jgi:glycosidase
MTNEGNGWFVYTIVGATSASIVFNNDPSPQTGDLSRNKEGWYKDGVWSDSNPEGPQKVVITANPVAGTYLTSQTVTLSSNNANGDIIYYTTNGTEPNSSSSVYSTPINVSSSMTIKAKGYNAGANPQWGDTYTFVYTIDPNADLQAPNIEVESGYPLPGRWATAPGNVKFRITDNKSATTIAYYTTNGSEPTTSSPIYVQGNASGSGLVGPAINVSDSMIIKFLVKDAANNETRKTFSYIIGLGNDFREETIYFVITTRFYDGAPENNVHCWDDTQAGNPDSDPAWRGDFEGLIQKLDYIKALGFSAIWITPPVKNASGYDYHGYHAINFKEIDPRYRTSTKTAEQSYRDFITAAHAKGMKVIQDIVLNHSSNFGEENLYPLFRRNAPALNNLNESITAALTKIAPPGKLPDNYDSLSPGMQYGARINAMKEDSIDTDHIYHHEKNLGWEDYTVQTAQIAGDCVDLNTEHPTVSQYLREAYLQYISWGVDAFRIDTVKHISRLTFNKEFIPQFTAAGGQYFYMFGETCARWRSSVWNFEKPCISPPFYTWKEEHPNYGSVNYPWGTRTERESSTLLHWNNNYSVNNEPTSNNHLLDGNNYRTVDYTYRNRFDQIDFPMHWNFNSANDAFNIALGGDQYYSDATWNVVYVDSHDYAPDGAPENKRYCGSWEEKLTLMFTFRGIPCLYYGSEIEFKKGMSIDVGPNAPLEQTGRAYFGNNITGTNPTVTDFGVWSGGTGNIVTTLNHPLAKHIQRLNQIRRKLPALQKGQYSTSGVSGNLLAFKRRYTDANIDNFVLVTINGDATFSGIPNGTYREVITGASVNVTTGTLSSSGCSGNGNARIYVLLGTNGMSDPGKIGTDGAYLK